MIPSIALSIEDKLIELLKIKNKAGIELLYNKYSKSLFGILINILNDKTLAEVSLQRSFAKIVNSISYYDSAKGGLFNWMALITRNIAKEYQQKDGCDTKYSPGITAFENEPKAILNLIYHKGYTHAEAAEELGISNDLVKKHFRRAIIMLRKIPEEC